MTSGQPGAGGLPPEIEAVIRRVLEAAGLDFVDGRAEVEEELRAHFEDGLAAGHAPKVLVERFGDPRVAGRRIARTRPRAAARNRGEEGRWWMSWREWWTETKRAARRLRRAPGFSLVVVLTLALGVGANTAIFTVLNAVLLEDLPYPEADRLVRIFEAYDEDPAGGEFLRAPEIGVFRGWDDVFENVGSLYTYREMGADLTGGEAPERVTVLWVSAGYFETLGIDVERGRTFTEDESFGAGEASSRTEPIRHVAVISHGLWGRRFGGSPDALGRMLELDDVTYEIVGILPRGFRNPFGGDTDVWLPHDLRPGGSNSYNNWFLSAVARLQPGVSVEQAQERVKVLADAWEEEIPETYGAWPRLIPLQEAVVGSTRTSMLWILAGAAALVLLTACVNVANLLFARGLGQDRSLALRSALGSGRGRLVATILLENGLLAMAGGAAGLALGWFGVQGLLSLAPGIVPGVTEIRVGLGVFLFASAVTAGALVVFGLTPALRMSRTAPADVLRSGDRAATVHRSLRRMRDGLVVLQVGTALALVAGATLFTRSFGELVDVPLGLEPESVLTYEVHLPPARYPDGTARHRFHEELQSRVADLPGVRSTGAVSWMPVKGRYHSWSLHWDADAPDEWNHNEHWYGTDVRMVAGDYFESMGIDVRRGVAPGEADLESRPMVWLNETAVSEVFGDTDPIGRRVYLADELREVMGIVEDVPHDTSAPVARCGSSSWPTTSRRSSPR